MAPGAGAVLTVKHYWIDGEGSLEHVVLQAVF